MIYIARLSNEKETLVKLGFTKFESPTKRYKHYYKNFDKVETLYTFSDTCVNYKVLEAHLNKFMLKSYKTTPFTDFKGSTECYKESDLSHIIKTVSLYSNLYEYRNDGKNLEPLPNRVSLSPFNKVKTYRVEFCKKYSREIFYINNEKFVPLLFSGLSLAFNETDGKVYNLRMKKLPVECKPHPVTKNYKTETSNKVFIEFTKEQVLKDLTE